MERESDELQKEIEESSPPRPVPAKDEQDWKIPPSISNWKDPKGYMIPLDKRLAAAGGADGRALQQEQQINDENFSKISEALYLAEQKARAANAARSKAPADRT